MADEPRQVTTFCPRCGQPLVWSARDEPNDHALELTGYSCYCVLTTDEWDDLTDEATAILAGEEG
jgi:hypothetical protein